VPGVTSRAASLVAVLVCATGLACANPVRSEGFSPPIGPETPESVTANRLVGSEGFSPLVRPPAAKAATTSPPVRAPGRAVSGRVIPAASLAESHLRLERPFPPAFQQSGAFTYPYASRGGGNDGIGFSIPSNLVRRVVEELLDHGQVQRAFLGVSLDPDFTRAEAQRLKLDRVRGAKVDRINADTPASRAGLRVDDIILSFEGIDVQDENHLINLVSLTAVGKKVKLVVFRNGEKQDVDVLLSDRAKYDQMSELPSQPGMGFPVEPTAIV